MQNNSFDFIIVGGGSSGCVLANRLSENPQYSVCLIEARPKDRSPWIHLPIGYAKTMWDPKLNWKFQTEPLRSFIVREVKPDNPQSNEEILEFCRNHGATIFHPTGTCQMGSDHDPMAVLDSSLRVRGVSGLRVVDCSAMPTLPSSNTNWSAVMLAERAADLILGKIKGP
jgi:choline dehydrogenase-like flavoprotein